MKRAFAWLAWAALALRLLWRTRAFAVDLFFWDEWDYRAGFFAGAGPWSLFDWQHGPHRMGLGSLATRALDAATAWDARAEAMAGALAAIAAAALCLALARRLFAPSYWDALVPLCALTGLLADALAGVANLAHGPLPLLLLVVFAHVALMRSAWRFPLALAVDFAALFTGFGLVLAPLSRAWLLAEGATRDRRALLALAASLGSLALFYWHYIFSPAVDCFAFPPARPLDLVPFSALLLERPLGLAGVGGLRALVVYPVALAVLAAFIAGALRSMRERPALAVALLAGYSLAFAALTAVGRVCLGVDAAASPRYAFYSVPGLLALFFAARAWLSQRALALLAVAFSLKEVRVEALPIKETQAVVSGKQGWRACYLRLGDVAACDAGTGFQLYPFPERTRLKEKLDWLRARRLSLFRNG